MLHADFGSTAFVPGNAELIFHQNNPPFLPGLPDITDIQTVRIQAKTPTVAVDANAPVAHIGDTAVALSGSHFEKVVGLRLDGTHYEKAPSSSATNACFIGPPVSAAITPNAVLSAQFLLDGKSAFGQVFPITIQAPRPTIRSVRIEPLKSVYFSNDAVRIIVNIADGSRPIRPALRVRQAFAPTSRCAGLLDEQAARIPDAAVLPMGESELDATSRMRDVLPKAAYGNLLIQVLDDDTKARSDWTPLPGTFARAPWIDRIRCGAAINQTCALMGTDLGVIGGIPNAAGNDVKPPYAPCTADDPHEECIVVPHLAHYVLQSVDTSIPIDVPDALINAPAPIKTH
jgi:hypothetical protein